MQIGAILGHELTISFLTIQKACLTITKTAFNVFFETLNGRLPVKQGSCTPENFPQHVSDHPHHLIFLRTNFFFDIFVGPEICSRWSFVKILGSCEFLDTTSSFLTLFCSGCTYCQPCTTLTAHFTMRTRCENILKIVLGCKIILNIAYLGVKSF